jgi:4-hydroxybutyryl-CoA dehydratase/vinylacetyl-CoA-Delta-isomerase
VDDLEAHALLGASVAEVAATYDRFYSPSPDAVSPLMSVPGSAEELKARIPLMHQADLVHHAHVEVGIVLLRGRTT